MVFLQPVSHMRAVADCAQLFPLEPCALGSLAGPHVLPKMQRGWYCRGNGHRLRTIPLSTMRPSSVPLTQVLSGAVIAFRDRQTHCSLIRLESCPSRARRVHRPENDQSSVTVPSQQSVASLGLEVSKAGGIQGCLERWSLSPQLLGPWEPAAECQQRAQRPARVAGETGADWLEPEG